MSECPRLTGLLILPRLRVQNANAVSAPLTWGFPSMTAFLGLMWALERALAPRLALQFHAVGVVCHAFSPQVTSGGFVRSFHLTRNPVDRNGNTAAIVEECRAHMEISLLFGLTGDALIESEALPGIAAQIDETVSRMRIAGGSVLPRTCSRTPELFLMGGDDEQRTKQFRRLRRSLLPGFTLVSRHDLLTARLAGLQAENPDATALDAWLDMSRINWRAESPSSDKAGDEADDAPPAATRWTHSRTHGWIVPMPVGYGALSPLHPAGSVANARDAATPFRFVESLYSLGQWIGPHHLSSVYQMLWYNEYDADQGLYLCHNDFTPTPYAPGA